MLEIFAVFGFASGLKIKNFNKLIILIRELSSIYFAKLSSLS